MKIAIYGTGNYSVILLKELEKNNYDINIVYFVESQKRSDCYYGQEVKNADEINFSDFEQLVVAYHDYREIVSYLKDTRGDYEINKEKIVDLVPFLSSIRYSKLSISNYRSVALSCGLEYFYDKNDMCIGGIMAAFDYNFSEEVIKAFFEMTDIYYGSRKRTGIFFDIGANIGTTSIYVKKKINSDLKVIGIEAGKHNYDLFRINCIINRCDDITAEHFGLGEYEQDGYFAYNKENSGGSTITFSDNGSNELVRVISLQNYCQNKNISPNDIDYIWIDTEGFEASIIEGAREVLQEVKIPILHEYNPKIYRNYGQLERYFSTISELYNSFICVEEFRKKQCSDVRHPISTLPEWTREMRAEQADLFFV